MTRMLFIRFCEQYLPADGDTIIVGPFSITGEGQTTSTDVRITDLQVVCRSNTTVKARQHL